MTIPTRMFGVQLVGHGGPEKLVCNDAIPVPAPGADEVLVRVRAAGVNNTDINTRLGWYSKDVTEATDAIGADAGIEAGGWSGELDFPLIQGADLCGEVGALGDGVADVAIGARVTCPTNQPVPAPDAPTRFVTIGSEFNGAFAEYCVLKANQVHDVSASSLSDTEIAAMPCAYGMAFNLVTQAGIGPGESILVTGASGGVGLAAVQISALKDARVTGVASPAKADAVRGAGAEAVIGRGDAPPAGAFDVVIDVVGGDGWGTVIEALKPGGRYVVSGAIAGPIVEADLRTIYLNDLSIKGCSYCAPETSAALIALINSGALRPVVSKTYLLRDIAAAQADFTAKRHPGKLVLVL